MYLNEPRYTVYYVMQYCATASGEGNRNLGLWYAYLLHALTSLLNASTMAVPNNCNAVHLTDNLSISKCGIACVCVLGAILPHAPV